MDWEGWFLGRWLLALVLVLVLGPVLLELVRYCGRMGVKE